jgi:hypothetical protein
MALGGLADQHSQNPYCREELADLADPAEERQALEVLPNALDCHLDDQFFEGESPGILS